VAELVNPSAEIWYNVDRLEELRRRDKIVDAVYKTGGILALGGLMYMGWWMYDFSTDIQKDLSQRFADIEGQIAQVDWGTVNPWLRTKEALDAYTEALGPTVTPWVLFNKVRSFADAQRFISEDGSVKAYSSSYYMIKEAEEVLVKAGKISAEEAEPMHPVDQVAAFVVHNKWYWGGVLGLAAIPSIGLFMDTVNEGVKDIEGR
jgi:hypothetical protein